MFFSREFVETCRTIANFYATTVGAIIYSLVSNDILENAHKIAAPLPRQEALNMPTNIAPNKSPKDGVYAVQGDDQDRLGSWRSLIRQEFAKKRSLVMFAPTVEEVKFLFASLEKGIEGYIFSLHSGLTPKKVSEVWQKISDTDHPVIVIATSQFTLLPRGDIDAVIIERENSRDWISKKAPYIDGRYALEYLARKHDQTVYLSDSILRTETLYRLQEQEISEGSPFQWRSISTARDMLVDMRRVRTAGVQVPFESKGGRDMNTDLIKEFRVISPQLENLIQNNIEDNTHLFIYNTRRGYSPSTICRDCHSVVICKQCSAPVVLHTSEKSGRNFFMCHKCGERRDANETCHNCDSWRLVTLGIGIDRVKEEIFARFPNTDIFQIDADNTKSTKQIGDILEKFKSRPGSILLGTEMTLSYLRDKIDHVAIASLDSLFALPDFRIQEKIMHTITRLRALSARTILVQTRLPTEKVFEYAMKGNLSDFYRQTLEERAQYKYPPFSILIKISIEGKKDNISEAMVMVQESLIPYHIDIFPAFTSTVRGNSIIHGLIKVEAHSWPDPDLVARLRALPRSVFVRIGPETLL
jgi:primosomal protein N' (replication factor Y)